MSEHVFNVEKTSSLTRYTRDGKAHREDGPALIYSDGYNEWYFDGQLHREDGPAVEYANGTKEWWLNGERHRVDGPAFIHPCGDSYWYQNNRLHRVDGPAVEYANGNYEYFFEGQLHNLNGPAIRYNGREVHYIEGRAYQLPQFLERVKILKGDKVINSFDDLNQIIGYRYFPDIESYAELAGALQCFDPGLRQVFRNYMQKFLDASGEVIEEDALVVYTYCGDCDHMVSDETDHQHCITCKRAFYADDEAILSCDQCESCCNHKECESCESHITMVCRDCNCCNNCCECVHCESCNALADCECGEGYCSNCCDCNNIDDEYESCGDPLVVRAGEKHTFNSKRLAGVEWEFNEINEGEKLLKSWKTRWDGRIHGDGSCGHEAVSAPAAGDYIAKNLNDLGEAIKHADVDDRCGLHVHVDARDLSWHDMWRLLRVYSKYEPFLYMLAGQHRMVNDYCSPIASRIGGASERENFFDVKGEILSFYVNEEVSYARSRMRDLSKKDGSRYKSLNIMPWLSGRRFKASDTTVEFRLHRNTKDANRVIGWTQLCVRLVDWCATASEADVRALPDSALHAFCKVIAPDLKDWILNRLKGWHEDTAIKRGAPRRVRFRNGKYVAVPYPEREIKRNAVQSESSDDTPQGCGCSICLRNRQRQYAQSINNDF